VRIFSKRSKLTSGRFFTRFDRQLKPVFPWPIGFEAQQRLSVRSLPPTRVIQCRRRIRDRPATARLLGFAPSFGRDSDCAAASIATEPSGADGLMFYVSSLPKT